MTDSIGIAISGDRQVALRFDEFPQQAHEALRAHITTLVADLRARVVAAEPKRTGRLERETVAVVNDGANRITGLVRISAEFGKAGALEYGAHGTAKLKAHYARLDHVYSRLVAPMSVMIAAHSRQVDIAEHRFLRSGLDAVRDEAVNEMRAALDEASDA